MRELVTMGIAAVALCAAGAARADVRVEYTIDAKLWKKAARPEQTLTIAAFSDDACTASVGSEEILAGDAAIFVEDLKRLAPKGAAKPAKTSLLQAVVGVAVPPAQPFYVTVTGDAVAAVGGACQAQMASVAGPDGDAGAQGAEGATG